MTKSCQRLVYHVTDCSCNFLNERLKIGQDVMWPSFWWRCNAHVIGLSQGLSPRRIRGIFQEI